MRTITHRWKINNGDGKHSDTGLDNHYAESLVTTQEVNKYDKK
jgi:hypothetical protein